MPDPVTGLVVAAGTSLIGSSMQSRSARQAAQIQAGAAQSGIDEQRAMFDRVQELLAPYRQAGLDSLSNLRPFEQAGVSAFEQQQALLGLRGPEAERAAIDRLSGGQTFNALARQGEEAILQQASATGGLRGGNTQAALAQFRPAMLQKLIDQQYSRLGGLAATGLGVSSDLYGRGQASAAGTGAAGSAMGVNVANLLGQQAQAEAGGQLATGRANAQLFNMPGQAFGALAGGGAFGRGGIFAPEAAPVPL